MNIQEIRTKIEILRSELTYEYENCIDNGGVTPKIMILSEKLDQLILEYIKISKIRNAQYNESQNSGIA